MSRQTIKYQKALEIAEEIGEDSNTGQTELYEKLIEHGWMWKPENKQWEYIGEAEEPTKLIKIRVWAEASKVEEHARRTAKAVESLTGYELLEKSKVYICRPPQQLEGRIYLSFKPKDNKNN